MIPTIIMDALKQDNPPVTYTRSDDYEVTVLDTLITVDATNYSWIHNLIQGPTVKLDGVNAYEFAPMEKRQLQKLIQEMYRQQRADNNKKRYDSAIAKITNGGDVKKQRIDS